MTKRDRWLLISLIVLNILNLLDFGLTTYLIDEGLARETNPLLVQLGIWVKIPIVLTASGLLWLVRNRADKLQPFLILTIAWYLAVVGYQVHYLVTSA